MLRPASAGTVFQPSAYEKHTEKYKISINKASKPRVLISDAEEKRVELIKQQNKEAKNPPNRPSGEDGNPSHLSGSGVHSKPDRSLQLS